MSKPKLSLSSRCHNCGIKFEPKLRPLFLITELVECHQKILMQWLNEHIPEDGVICAACITKIVNCDKIDNPPREVGHSEVCTGCGQSVLRKRYRKFNRDEDLSSLIPEYKLYQHYKTGQYFLCLNCCKYLQISKNISDNVPEKQASGDISIKETFKDEKINTIDVAKFENDAIILPGYKRLSLRKRKCLIPKCNNPAKALSPGKRKLLLLQTNTLLIRCTSLCNKHASFNNSQQLGVNTFNKKAVEDALFMSEKPVSTIDFDRVQEMPEYLCKYWTGLTTDQFQTLYENLNVDTGQFHSLRNALAAHLLREKSGDSILKLANLFLMSTSSLSRQLLLIEKSLKTYSNGENESDKVVS